MIRLNYKNRTALNALGQQRIAGETARAFRLYATMGVCCTNEVAR